MNLKGLTYSVCFATDIKEAVLFSVALTVGTG